MCGKRYNLHRHHVIHGTSNRKNSEKYGLTVYLCMEHHRIVHEVDRQQDLHLIKIAQRAFEDRYDHDTFMKVFGKNYL